jgi:hypothetical protein
MIIKNFRIDHNDGSMLRVHAKIWINDNFAEVVVSYYGSDGYLKASLGHEFKTTAEDFERQIDFAKSTAKKVTEILPLKMSEAYHD